MRQSGEKSGEYGQENNAENTFLHSLANHLPAFGFLPLSGGGEDCRKWQRTIEYEVVSEPFSFSTGDGVLKAGQSQRPLRKNEQNVEMQGTDPFIGTSVGSELTNGVFL
jgi:hypothetical protein